MVGVESDSRGERAVPTQPGVAPATSAGATALEVAGLRERMDGVSLKLDDVDRRVVVLEAAGDSKGGLGEEAVSEQPGTFGGHREARAKDTSADQVSADGAARSETQPAASPAAQGLASVGFGADLPPSMPAAAPSSVVLMLTDVQFEKWLEGINPPPAGGTPAEREWQGDRRLRRNAGRATRSERR